MDTFETMYHEYSKDIYCFLLKITGYNRELSEELLQETFLQTFQSFYRFRGECSLKTWICQIAKNTYFKYLK